MEYNLKNMINNLASQPFCLPAEENAALSSQLNCDFYLNGLNTTTTVGGNFGEKRNIFPTEVISCVPDLSKETYSLDNLFEDDFISSLQQTGDDIFDNINLATPLVNENKNVNGVFDNQISVTSSTSSISTISDLSFDLLESLEQSTDVEDKTSTVEKQNDMDDLQFEFMETTDIPVSEVSSNMNTLTSASPNMTFFSSNISVLQEGKQKDNDFVEFSPQSVDSGISMASSPSGSAYGELSDLNNFFSGQNSPQHQYQINGWNLDSSSQFTEPSITKKDMSAGLSSPQSDSGLSSMASSPRSESPILSPIMPSSPKSESPVFDASAELLNILSMAESSSLNQPLQFNSTADIISALSTGYQIVNVASPSSVSSASSVSGESNCDSENYLSDQSNLSPISQQQLSPSASNNIDFLNENVSDNRYKPYSKPKKERTPEQKQRKKTQNRSAASRYRTKKKDEFNVIFAEANKLEETNKGLKDKVEGLRKEIDYLKSLMLDVINARLSNKPVVDISNLVKSTA